LAPGNGFLERFVEVHFDYGLFGCGSIPRTP
jgi:hypothetical protein